MEEILTAAAHLLQERGFEQMSTNLICKHAGLTPPALYRYFSSKYAVLAALGQRLMEAQNEVLLLWSEDIPLTTPDLPARLRTLLHETLKVTRGYPSGVWVIRTLRATPTLSQVRIDSHRQVAQQLTDRLLSDHPELDRQRACARIRLGVEYGYAALEMIFDEPDMDEGLLLDEASEALANLLAKTLTEHR